MTTARIAITRDDLRQLNDLLQEIGSSPSRDAGHIDSLRREIRRAKIVRHSGTGPEIVTLNCTVLLEDLDTNERFSIEIVLPQQADADAGRISVLAPVATAVLGCKAGDVVIQEVPGGKRRLGIKSCTRTPQPVEYAAAD